MIRLFDRHEVREVRELGGLWDFVSEEYPERHYRLPVPSCWEIHPDFLNYRGRGVYTTTLRVARKSNLRLVFGGVSHTAAVYFDGAQVAHHYNAYTPFDAILHDVEAGEHTLTVHCDNTFTEASALHKANDYHTYGGIIRAVSVETLPSVYIWQFADCRVTEEGGWFQSRARTRNNKGIFDEYRRPKLALETVKRHFK